LYIEYTQFSADTLNLDKVECRACVAGIFFDFVERIKHVIEFGFTLVLFKKNLSNGIEMSYKNYFSTNLFKKVFTQSTFDRLIPFLNFYQINAETPPLKIRQEHICNLFQSFPEVVESVTKYLR